MTAWVPPSNTACKLKWTWSTIFLNSATTKSCYHNPVSKFNTQTFDFHNIPIKVEDRRQMLAGEWPAGCNYCSRTESLGGKSDRQSQNEIPTHLPHDTELVTEPKILEVFFNNTCNLSCIYCGPALSSTWAEETRKFGSITDSVRSEPFELNKKEYTNTVEQFFIWLTANKHQIDRINVLGGEPFLLSETDRLVDALSMDTSNIELNLVSNLMIPRELFVRKVDKLVKLVNNKNVSQVSILASIDGWGKEVDFQRYGIDRGLWLDNFNTLLSTPEITLGINLALTCLSISSLPELITMWNTWNQVREVGLQGNRVFNPSFLAPEVLPARLNKHYFEQALDLISEDTWYKRWSKERFSSLISILDKYPEGNQKEMLKLKTFLDNISRRREVDWTKVFPDIARELTNKETI